jgi:hypothetical protein
LAFPRESATAKYGVVYQFVLAAIVANGQIVAFHFFEAYRVGDMYLLPFLAQSAGALWNTGRRPQSVHNPLITSPEQRRLLGSEIAVKCDAVFLIQFWRQAVSAMHPRKQSIFSSTHAYLSAGEGVVAR